MHAQKIVLASLLIALSACQKESAAPAAPAEQPAQPAAAAPAAETPAPAAEAPAAEAPAAMDHTMMDHSGMMMGEAASAAPEAAAPAAPPPAAPAAAPAPAPAPAPAMTMTGPSGGTDPLQLAKKDGCLTCHSVDKKIIGPAWKDVAAKYRGDATAEAKLFDKVTKGGSGVWGAVPMPPNGQYPEADRHALVKFILSLQ